MSDALTSIKIKNIHVKNNVFLAEKWSRQSLAPDLAEILIKS